MPGMMETILNLGLNDKSVEGLARTTKNERFAYDAYRRFVQMYSSVVIGLPKEDLEDRLRAMKQSLNVKDDTQVTRGGMEAVGGRVQGVLQTKDWEGIPGRPGRAAVGSDRRGF